MWPYWRRCGLVGGHCEALRPFFAPASLFHSEYTKKDRVKVREKPIMNL